MAVEHSRNPMPAAGLPWLPTGYSQPVWQGWVNVALGLVLLGLALPLIAVVVLLVLSIDGRPVFYRGTRLGKGKRRFEMYKFRTLVRDAEARIGHELVGGRHCLTTPLGQVLRETRLDELPQLVNVIKGDMNIVGPRPIRPLVYEKSCTSIRGFDRRFEVKPGLLGYTQLFTPHGSPKRLRARIDNRFVARHGTLIGQITLILLTQMAVHQRIWQRVRALVRLAWKAGWSGFSENRKLERVPLHDAKALLGPVPSVEGEVWRPWEGRIADINDDYLLLWCNDDLQAQSFHLEMSIFNTSGVLVERSKRKTAKCRCTLEDGGRRPGGGGYRHGYVMKYSPVSPLNQYIVQQYFQRLSVIR